VSASSQGGETAPPVERSRPRRRARREPRETRAHFWATLRVRRDGELVLDLALEMLSVLRARSGQRVVVRAGNRELGGRIFKSHVLFDAAVRFDDFGDEVRVRMLP
jgi:hypothetical protein